MQDRNLAFRRRAPSHIEQIRLRVLARLIERGAIKRGPEKSLVEVFPNKLVTRNGMALPG
jgi:hypothetical protein